MILKSKKNSNQTLIFACSGASDVGELADRTARRMTRSGYGKMYCLSAIGGGLQDYIDNTEAAEKVIIIDGCSKGCANKIMSKINANSDHYDLEVMGFQKGKSPCNGENIKSALNQIEKNYINKII